MQKSPFKRRVHGGWYSRRSHNLWTSRVLCLQLTVLWWKCLVKLEGSLKSVDWMINTSWRCGRMECFTMLSSSAKRRMQDMGVAGQKSLYFYIDSILASWANSAIAFVTKFPLILSQIAKTMCSSYTFVTTRNVKWRDLLFMLIPIAFSHFWSRYNIQNIQNIQIYSNIWLRIKLEAQCVSRQSCNLWS